MSRRGIQVLLAPTLLRRAGGVIVLAALALPAQAQSRGSAPPSQQFNLSTPAQEFKATPDRLERLTLWVLAVATHSLGSRDEASRLVNSWDLRQLQALWVDLSMLGRVMRNRSAGGFTIDTRDGMAIRVIYTPGQLNSIAMLGCVAGGYLHPSSATLPASHPARQCFDTVKLADLSGDEREAAGRFARARVALGDDNLFFRRAALLHSDIAMLEPPLSVSVNAPSYAIGPRRTQIELLDGQALSMTLAGIHWQMAEAALGFVQPADATRPAPNRDPMVREWYQATAMWMQKEERHDLQHLEEARRLFPDDPVLLFLIGCEHEAYGAPAIQAPLRSSGHPPGTPGSAGSEWRRAEGFFKEAIRAAPDSPAPKLHRGRVLSLIGQHAEAVVELQRALAMIDDSDERYFGELFLGQALEDDGKFVEAQQAFERARMQMPSAQTPLLALSQLARRRDDYGTARSAIEGLFAPSEGDETGDPWWDYFVSHAQEADARVRDVWDSVEVAW